MEDVTQRIFRTMEKNSRYALKGEFGLDWEEFLYFIVRLDSEEDKKQLETRTDSCVLSLMEQYPQKNYLSVHVIMSLLRYLDNKRTDKNLLLYYIVNRAALFVFKTNNYTNDELKNMIEIYKDDFNNLTSLVRKDLNPRDEILYSIIMLNVLSYRVVATEISGAYTYTQINNGFFADTLIRMSKFGNT